MVDPWEQETDQRRRAKLTRMNERVDVRTRCTYVATISAGMDKGSVALSMLLKKWAV